jgi:hypothetical protein
MVSIFRSVVLLRWPPVVPWVCLVLATALFSYHITERSLGGLSSDSLSYLEPALLYEQTGTLMFAPGREPGYRAFILAVSRVAPWESQEQLAYIVTAIQLAALIGTIISLTWEAWRIAGPLAASVIIGLIAVDRYNLQWVFTVQSEAPSRILVLAGLALVFFGLSRQRSWITGLGALLFGLIPLVRPSDIAIPAAAGVAVAAWVLLRFSRRHTFIGMGLIVTLLGPTLLWSQYHGWTTGYFGLTERSAWHLAGRLLTLVEPERLEAAGLDRDYVISVARPVHEAYAPERDAREIVVNDLGQPTPLTIRTMPAPRREPSALTPPILASRGLPSDDQHTATFLDEQSRRVLRAEFVYVAKAILPIAAELLYVPLLRPFYDRSLRNKLFWLVPIAGIAAIVILAMMQRPLPVESLAIVVAALALLPLYAGVCSLAGFYNPRFASLQHLPASLACVVACLIAVKPNKSATHA